MQSEVDVLECARKIAIAARTPVELGAPMDVKRLAECDFLRSLVGHLQPMLRQAMRSHRIVLARDPRGVVALTSDGLLVRVDIADQEDVLTTEEVLSVEPNLLTILDHIEAELLAACDARASKAALLVRGARDALEDTGG